MNKYDDIITSALKLISWFLGLPNKLKTGFRKYLNKYSHTKLGGIVSKFVASILGAESTPKGHWGSRYSPHKIVFKDKLDSELFQDIAHLQVFLKDYAHLKLNSTYFVIRRKTELISFCNAFIPEADQRKGDGFVKKVIDQDVLVDGLFYVKSITQEEYRNTPRNLKLILKKEEVNA